MTSYGPTTPSSCISYTPAALCRRIYLIDSLHTCVQICPALSFVRILHSAALLLIVTLVPYAWIVTKLHRCPQCTNGT